MNPGFLPCYLLLSVEPTDRALTGWCPLDPAGFTSVAAAERFLDGRAHSEAGVYGRAP